MTYVCTFGIGQKIFLDNQATQTKVTVASSQAGQQQQASSSFQTGTWTAPPQAFQSGSGVLIKIQTAQGEQIIQVQGSSIQVGTFAISEPTQVLPMQQVEQADSLPEMQPIEPMQPMQPIEPMQPMQPMQMGNMSMNLNPMEMRMGDMKLRIDTTKPAPTAQKFCGQCGASVKPDDRFCTSCGSRLNLA